MDHPQGDTAQAAATTGARSKHFAAAASDTGNFGSASMEASSKDSSSGSNKTNDGSVGRDQGTLKFLWAPRRMDGRPIATGVDEEEGGGSEARGGGDVPLIMFALLHHRHAFTADDGLMDIGTPTLHGQVMVAFSRVSILEAGSVPRVLFCFSRTCVLARHLYQESVMASPP